MLKQFAFALLATGIAAGSTAIAAPVTISAQQDVFTYAFTPNANYNGSSSGFDTVLSTALDPQGHDLQSYLQFNFSGVTLAPGEIARLNLYVGSTTAVGFPGGDPSAVHPSTTNLAVIDESWAEDDVTANDHPPYGPTFTSFVVDGVNKWVSVDITGQVAQWLAAPATNFGLALTAAAIVPDGTGTSVAVLYNSSESASNNPFIEVVAAVPEPASVGLLAVGIALAASGRRRRER